MRPNTTASLPFDAATVEFDPLLRRLNLASTRRHWRELLRNTPNGRGGISGNGTAAGNGTCRWDGSHCSERTR